MHLLRTDTEGLELVTFNNEQHIPQYAILSHTWLSDEHEVSFADLTRAIDTTAKLGRNKIDFSKREALAGGFRYVWIDTCCIDKSSSAELAEAINSMFRWYRNAEICYVYLEDMPDAVCLSEETVMSSGNAPSETVELQFNGADFEQEATIFQNEPPHSLDMWSCGAASDEPLGSRCSSTHVQCQTVMIEALRRCKWFTRGWTLQELLAPKQLSFFAKSWHGSIGGLDRRSSWDWVQEKQIGSSSTRFSRLVSSITGIHEPVLIQEMPLERYSVAQRMSWAAARVTTRVEDRAYCMLGIFDINMPVLYGEGGKAFERLQLEIIRLSPDQTIFAWESDSRRMQGHMSLLAPWPEYFASLTDLVRVPDLEQGGHEVTSKGIRLCLPLRTHGRLARNESVTLGMLACRRENDYTKAVALNMCSTLQNTHVTNFEQHYYVRGLVDLDLHETTKDQSKQVLIKLQHPTIATPNIQQTKRGASIKIVFRCVGRGAIENDVNIVGTAPLSSWSKDRRAFEFQLPFAPYYHAEHPQHTDIPWIPRWVDFDTGFGVGYDHCAAVSPGELDPGRILANQQWRPSLPTSTQPYFAGRLALTCRAQDCGILLVSATTIQRLFFTKGHSEDTSKPVYDFRIFTSEQEIGEHAGTSHHELELNGPSLLRRRLLPNGVMISAEAKSMLFLDQEVVLVEIKAMRLARSQASPLARPSTHELDVTNPRTTRPKSSQKRVECQLCPGRVSMRFSNAMRHHSQVHGDRYYKCTHYGCIYTNSRLDKFKEHCYKAHGQDRNNADFTTMGTAWNFKYISMPEKRVTED